MRIIMPTFEKIEWMPPTIALIETLAQQGHEIYYISVYPDDFFAHRPWHHRIHNVSLCGKTLILQDRIPYIKGISGALFRIDNLVKKCISRRLSRVIDSLWSEDSLLWVVNEMTVMLAGTQFLKGRDYAFTVYELHERKAYARGIERAAKNAKVVVVPEYCRAHIMRSRYSLERLPVVLPNKTEIEVSSQPLSADAQAAIDLLDRHQAQGITTLLYMGLINQERPLDALLEALERDQRFRLAVMGRPSPYLSELQQKYPHQFDYLGAFTPPEHIAVAAHAQIGVLIYVSLNQIQGLNALFCAPNKLYEYTGQGLPILANDIPGLRFPIETHHLGSIVDFSDPDAIIEGICHIQQHYPQLQANARLFFSGTDVSATVSRILQLLNT